MEPLRGSIVAGGLAATRFDPLLIYVNDCQIGCAKPAAVLPERSVEGTRRPRGVLQCPESCGNNRPVNRRLANL